MPTMNFFTDAPALSNFAVDHPASEIASSLDRWLEDPAYLDPLNPRHETVKAQVGARMVMLVGEKPIDGGQPFKVFEMNDPAA